MKTKKIIITALGLAVLIGTQYYIFGVALKGELGAVALTPFFAVVYFIYLRIMISKYIKS